MISYFPPKCKFTIPFLVDKWYNLAYENVISEIEFLDNDIYEMLEDIFSEVDYREFKMKYGLY